MTGKRWPNAPMRFQHDDLTIDELLAITPMYVEATERPWPRKMTKAQRYKYLRQTAFYWMLEHGYEDDDQHSPWVWNGAREAFTVHAIICEEEIDNLNAHRDSRKKQFAEQLAKYERWAASPEGIAAAAQRAADHEYFKNFRLPQMEPDPPPPSSGSFAEYFVPTPFQTRSERLAEARAHVNALIKAGVLPPKEKTKKRKLSFRKPRYSK